MGRCDAAAGDVVAVSEVVAQFSALPRIHVGCSGWNYKSWRDTFYPTSLHSSGWLAYYGDRFDTVEINNSFYRLPERSVFDRWQHQVGNQFIFAVKASRYLTHMKRLREPHEAVARLFDRVSALGPKLGPVLYQLPPNFHIDIARLHQFLAILPDGVRHVFEFRDPSWYTDATFACLEKHSVSLCLHDMAGSAIAEPRVGPCLYLRFHGTAGRYQGGYTDAVLRQWADAILGAANDGQDVYAYFNNDPEAEAVRNAVALRGHIELMTAAS